jgi:DNA polymerase-3 subunit delta'
MKEIHPWNQVALRNLLEMRAHLPNALLIKGAAGIGKLDLALNFAQSLLCEKPTSEGLPCCQCNSCHWFDLDTHPDFRLVQPPSLATEDDNVEKEAGKKPSREISVDQIRDLANFANLSSHMGGYRIVLIHPAESMNRNSANAVLKTLEEPTDKLLFILVTHKPQQLLPTILSRCLSFTVNTPNFEIGAEWLKNHGVDQPESFLAQAGYAPLQALHLAEDETGADERNLLLSSIQRPSQMDALLLAEKLQRSAPVLVIQCLQQWCYDLASAKLTGKVRYFPDQLDLLKHLSSNISSMRMLGFQSELLTAKREAYHPLNPKLQFESILLSYKQMTASANA